MAATPVPSEKIYELVGARIRGERTKLRLTQEELAIRVGLKRTSITNIEKGKQKLLLHTLVHFASALGVSPKELLSPLEQSSARNFESTLPHDLSPSVKNWIIAGFDTANRNK